MMKRTLTLLLAAALASGCSKDEPEAPTTDAAEQAEAQSTEQDSAAEGESTQPTTVGTFAHPESAIVHGDKIYITNLGAALKPTEKDGDGFIKVMDLSASEDSAELFTIDSYLHAPKGTMVWGGALYVADVNYIYGFDLAEGHSLVFAVEPGLQHPDDPQPKFLNGLTVKDDTSFFVSATDTNVIYRITNDFVPAIYKMEISDELKGPNGLAYDAEANKLYVAGWGTNDQANGELGVIDLNTPPPHSYTRLGTHSGRLDGLVKVGEKLYFSDWVDFKKSGHIYSYDLASGKQSKITKTAIGGPADFNLSADGKSLIVPAMLENKVVTVPLS